MPGKPQPCWSARTLHRSPAAPRCSHLLVHYSLLQSNPPTPASPTEKKNQPDPAQIHPDAPSKRLMPSCHHPKAWSSPSPPHGSTKQWRFQRSCHRPPLQRYFKALFSFKESSSRRGRWQRTPTASRSPVEVMDELTKHLHLAPLTMRSVFKYEKKKLKASIKASL